MANDSRLVVKGSTPFTSKRLRRLLDEGRLAFVGSVSAHPRSGRVLVVADEVDPPDHQWVTITTR